MELKASAKMQIAFGHISTGASLKLSRKPKNQDKIQNTKTNVATARPDPDDVGGLVSEIVDDLPEGTSPELVEKIQVLASRSSYSGPIPSAQEFAGYESVVPGAADRILKMAETEQNVRKRDNRHMLNNETLKIIGSIVISGGLIVAGVYCGVIGQPWLGGVLGTSGVIAGIMSKMRSK